MSVPREQVDSYVLLWLARERAAQGAKFTATHDDVHLLAGLGDESWWWQQLTSYYGRARTLGLDTPVGRQALGKFCATAVAVLAAAVRNFGDLPAPGHSSGSLADWDADLD